MKIQWYACLALLLAGGPAGSVMLSQDGTGQALIFPVYSVNPNDLGGAMDTLVVINNERTAPKAVRVTLREADVGHAVLALNLYLGPLDSWSFALALGEGGPELISNDTSCVHPAIPDGRIALSAAAIEAAEDGVEHDPAARLRHGYLEVIELGVLTGAAADLASTGLVQADCAGLRARWEAGGAWDQDPGFELAAPDGGLAGLAWLINVGAGHAYDYAATALARFSAQVLHRAPELEVGLDEVDAPDPGGSGRTRSTVITTGGPVDLLWEQPIDAVTSVLMTEALTGDLATDDTVGARSEMVLSLPTKRHYVFAGHAGGQPVPRAPFANAIDGTGAYSGSLAVLVSRDGLIDDRSDTCLDPPPPPPGLNWAVQSFDDGDFEDPAPITGAVNRVPFYPIELIFLPPLPLRYAKLRTEFRQRLGTWWCGDVPQLQNPGLDGETADGETVHLPGLPALALTLQQISNNTLEIDGERVLSNYGASFPVRRETRVEPVEP